MDSASSCGNHTAGLATVGKDTGVKLPLEMAGEMGLGREVINFWSSLVRSHLVRLAYSINVGLKGCGSSQVTNGKGRSCLESGAGKQLYAGLK